MLLCKRWMSCVLLRMSSLMMSFLMMMMSVIGISRLLGNCTWRREAPAMQLMEIRDRDKVVVVFDEAGCVMTVIVT